MYRLECSLFLIVVLVLGTGVSQGIQGTQGTQGATGSANDVIETSPTVAADELAETELVMIHSIFRHGDRTPDQAEMDLFPLNTIDNKAFFPYGLGALTNRGMLHAYAVGQNMRRRYHGLLSSLYIPDQFRMRTTDYDRTKMTALALLAGLYPPQRAQLWNPKLEWQPIPYDTVPGPDDDLLYYYHCPRYIQLLDSQGNGPEASKLLEPYRDVMEKLSINSGFNITLAEEAFFLDNLFQAQENVGIEVPPWAVPLMPGVKELTKIAYTVQFSTDEMTRLAGGRLIYDVISRMVAAAARAPRRRALLYSAHENNVAALMAAARVFASHQPAYACLFTLELRRHIASQEYGVTAVYTRNPSSEPEILNIPGCGVFCPLRIFVEQSKAFAISPDQYQSQCRRRDETTDSGDKN